MPDIQPIRAITYTAGEDLSDRIAPPYDVLDTDRKRRLLQKSPHNIVAIDLPHLPAKTVGPDEAYEQAGLTFRQWLDEGVLRRHDRPAVFVYRQCYTARDHSFERLGLIANVRVQPLGASAGPGGGIHPHEQTYPDAKEDRLKLMRATRAQLSPIFGLYSDPDQTVGAALEKVTTSGSPSSHGKTDVDGVLHEIWPVHDPSMIERFGQMLARRDLTIADGHHRYHTALTYRCEQQDQGANGGEYCMFVLVSMHDPGLFVLPTHRVICGPAGFGMDQLLQATARRVDLVATAAADGPDQLAQIERMLPGSGHHAMALYDPTASRICVLHTTQEDPLAQFCPERSEAWRGLDVAVLHELVIERFLRRESGVSLTHKYTADLVELRQMAEAAPGRLGVILQPPSLDAVRRVSEAGELMPAKSTFFYPKLATGFVLNPLD